METVLSFLFSFPLWIIRDLGFGVAGKERKPQKVVSLLVILSRGKRRHLGLHLGLLCVNGNTG